MAENLAYLPKLTNVNNYPPKDEEQFLIYGGIYLDVDASLSDAKASSIYKQCGALYNWQAAVKSCPTGWHLPNLEDYYDLMKATEGNDSAGRYLKSSSTWKSFDFYNTDIEVDPYGLSSLACGYSTPDGFANQTYGEFAHLWFDVEQSYTDASYGSIDYSGSSFDAYNNFDKDWFLSVRCVEDY